VACDAAFRPEVVRVLLARGRVDEADAEAGQLEELARRRGGRVLGAVARLARARVLAAQRRPDEALAALAAAREAFVAAGQRYEAARCARLEVGLRGPGAPVPDERSKRSSSSTRTREREGRSLRAPSKGERARSCFDGLGTSGRARTH
jgi:hypothetical protein